MKNLFFCIIIALSSCIYAAPIRNHAVTLKQPDGSQISCFVSGDEYFNYYHDANDYTIIQGKDGFYYYAVTENDRVIPSEYRVGSIDPVAAGIPRKALISNKKYQERRTAINETSPKQAKNIPSKIPHEGLLNNLVIFIRFSDQTEFQDSSCQIYARRMNGDFPSLKDYYNAVSYGKLNVSTSFFPAIGGETIEGVNVKSYQDPETQGYYQVYDSANNPKGYINESERRTRESSLLKKAIDWATTNHLIPSSLNVDGDNDGYIDNIIFIVRGNAPGWSELLWPHQWVTTLPASVNGKIFRNYIIMPEDYVSVQTTCHEFYHTLGAPDLYHYTDYNGTYIAPVDMWDLMDYGAGHISSYMKWKYADKKWIENIPVIDSFGTYTLNPLASPTNNCYKLASPFSKDQYFVIEYRRKIANTYESALPGSGLIIYKIDSRFTGNANADGVYRFDEIYAYRPNGSPRVNGDTKDAFFSAESERTRFNSITTNPRCFLNDSSNGGIAITNIGSAGETISFDIVKDSSNFLFDLSADSLSIRNESYDYAEITITTNMTSWTVSSSESWLDFSNLIALKSIDVFAKSKNTTPSPRTAYLTIHTPDFSSHIVKITQAGDTTSVCNINGENVTLYVSPNPAKNTLNIFSPKYLIKQIEIINPTGMVIKTIKQSSLTSSINQVAISDLASGMYFIRIQTGQGEVVKKFIKE